MKGCRELSLQIPKQVFECLVVGVVVCPGVGTSDVTLAAE